MVRVALVTGGAGAVGGAVARALLRGGWAVVCVTRDGGAPEGAWGWACDLRDAAAVERAGWRARAELGRVDALVCCAGVCWGGWDGFEEAFEVNAAAGDVLVRAVGDAVDGGVVVHVGSGDGESAYLGGWVWGAVNGAGCVGELREVVRSVAAARDRDAAVFHEQPAYALSKACQHRLARASAAALAGRVRVVVVCPGDVASRMGAGRAPQEAAREIVDVVEGRVGDSGGWYRYGARIAW